MGRNSGRDEREDQSTGGGSDSDDETDNDRQSKKDGQSNGGRASNGGETSTAEKAMMVVSVLFALSLVAYGGWQMATASDGRTPSATVVETESTPSGEVAVTVRLTNPGDVGLVTTTVQANCSTPPPSVQFTYVPASSTREGTLVCPSGTTSPNVSVVNWITA